MITIPSTTKNVGAQLSKEHATQKRKNSQALWQIFSSIKFLCRQGLPLRGHNEDDGNFQQVLKLKAEEDPNLFEWLRRKEDIYTSAGIQNEMIKLMVFKFFETWLKHSALLLFCL